MTDKTNFFGERIRVSADLAERVRQRWGVVFYAVENEHQAQIVDHGPNFLRPESTISTPVERPIDAAQIGSQVASLDAYRERQEFRQYSETLQSERLAADARQAAEEARRDFAA